MLDESAWSDAVVIELPFEIDPGENLPALVRTECFLISGSKYLYIAFHAYDPEPSAIRAHYVDRDTAWDDDWVFVTLDPFFDQRRGFQFIANPFGVQMDSLLNEVGGGGSEVDLTWDAIWESAGNITPDGYIVEMAIPYTSLRFSRTEKVQQWGFQAMRKYPRKFTYYFRATPWDRNKDCTLCENVILNGLLRASPGRNLEFIPTITSHKTDLRDALPESSMKRGEVKAELGLSSRWGITPNFQLNATLNPDFSQVEADVAQLDINKRFALFYPEKRPFFLEGADLFKTPFNAVYTRTMADPLWGFKFTGKENRHAFGILVAQDKLTNVLLPSNQSSQLSFLNQRSITSIVRYRRDVGNRSIVGVLLTDRRSNDYSNSIFGGDGYIQISSSDSLGFQFLRSQTRYPEKFSSEMNEPRNSFSSQAFSLSYHHIARNWNWWINYENLGLNFRSDIGFIPRVDARTAMLGIRHILWGESKSWFSRILLTIEGQYTEDQNGNQTDELLKFTGEFNGPLQSMLFMSVEKKGELFGNIFFDQMFLQFDCGVRPVGNLAFSFSGKIGDAIDYMGLRPAEIVRLNPGFSCFLGRHLQLQVDHSIEKLSIDSGKLYVANLSQVRIVYQFSVRTFVRAILQYQNINRNLDFYPHMPDPVNHTFFTQFLFSYKLNPQTLLFLGYSDNWSGLSGLDLVQKDRTFFIKFSYAWLY